MQQWYYISIYSPQPKSLRPGVGRFRNFVSVFYEYWVALKSSGEIRILRITTNIRLEPTVKMLSKPALWAPKSIPAWRFFAIGRRLLRFLQCIFRMRPKFITHASCMAWLERDTFTFMQEQKLFVSFFCLFRAPILPVDLHFNEYKVYKPCTNQRKYINTRIYDVVYSSIHWMKRFINSLTAFVHYRRHSTFDGQIKYLE